ncbi:hypothetical protein [Mucilaginibacter kameinonensis]|uniref:hypothetical protein n=1 Tax=Mucilaginibacter kameinonensis TaxID=452286 RepID=UPI000EF76B35|nr:hypothetical protein [Mucilaginibacter kameinonensis]
MEELKEIDITRKHDLTIEELRAYCLFANFTDGQLIEIIATIKKLTKIAFSIHLNQNNTND